MDKRKKDMILFVSKINLIMAFLVALIISFFDVFMAIAFIAGTITALINFIINAYVVDKAFKGIKKKARIFIQLSFVIRMLLILGVAVLFRGNHINLIIYLVGFIFHQVAIFIYARKK